MRADWTASGACTSGSTAPPKDATRRASGGAATTSTTSAERHCGYRDVTAGFWTSSKKVPISSRTSGPAFDGPDFDTGEFGARHFIGRLIGITPIFSKTVKARASDPGILMNRLYDFAPDIARGCHRYAWRSFVRGQKQESSRLATEVVSVDRGCHARCASAQL